MRTSANVLATHALVLVWASGASGQATRDDAILNSLAVVYSDFEAGHREEGTAFVVGREAARLFLITADHVVFDGRVMATGITVVMKLCGSPMPAQSGLPDIDGRLELAVLRVDVPPSCQARLHEIPHIHLALSQIEAAATGRTGQPLVVFGRGRGGAVERFEQGNSVAAWVEGAFFMIDSANIERGMSGGLAMSTDRKLVGMLLQTRRAVRIDVVVAELRVRKVPTSFLESFATLHVLEYPVGARLSVDNEPEAPVRPEQQIVVGRRRVRISAPGFEPATSAFEFRVDETKVLCADLSPPADAWWVSARWPLGATAGASLIAGGVFGVLALNAKSRFDDRPATQSYDDTGKYNTLTDVFLFSGLGLAAAFGLGHALFETSGKSYLTETCN
jgi:hypothetical protein